MKRSILFSLLYGALFIVAIPLPAQSPCADLTLPREQVRLQLDRNVCLAGETIWFKAWCFLDGQREGELSKVLYVEIFDENQKAIVQEKYVLDDHRAAGAIRIPDDVPSKYYFLKAYTRYMRNFSSSAYHYQQIVVVNPLIKTGSIQVKAGAAAANQEPPAERSAASTPAKNLLQVELSQEKYNAREPVNFQIKSVKPLTAELSAVVRLKGLGNQPAQEVLRQNRWLQPSCQEDPFCRASELAEAPADETPAPQEDHTPPLQAGELQWLPETRGLTISGVVQNEKEERVANASTLVAVLQKDPMLHMGTTDQEGGFTICLQNMQYQKVLFVGTPDEGDRVLIRNDFDTNLPKITAVPLQYDSALHPLLESLHLHQQLDRTYPEQETQAAFTPQPLRTPSSNILAPDRRISLDDFIEVPTMSEVLNEIASGITIRIKEGKKSLVLFNAEQQKWFDSPLILLDNVPIFNIDELLKIAPAKIEAIDIIYSDYILGDYTIGGIVSIISKTDDFAGYKWGKQVAFTTFKAFATPRTFEQVVRLEKSHYPDFQPVLYWQPGLRLEQEQASEAISIIAPDRPGTYEVLVQGYTDSGEVCWGYATFEVVRDR